MELINTNYGTGDLEKFKSRVNNVSQLFESATTQTSDFTHQVKSAQTYFRNLETMLTHYLKNADDARKITAELFQFSAWSPFSVENITESALALASIGVGAKSLTGSLLALGDVSAVLSLPLQSVTTFFGTMVSKGDVGLKELVMTLQELTSQTGAFYNAMKRQSADQLQLLQKLNDSWKALAISLLSHKKDVGDVVDKYQSLQQILGLINSSSGALKSVASAVSTFNTFEKAGNDLGGVFKTFATLAKGNIYATIAVEAYNTAKAIYQLYNSVMLSISPTRMLQQATNDYNKSVEKERLEIDLLFQRLRHAKEGTQEYKDAKDAILNKYGAYLTGLSKEIRLLWDMDGAYKAITSSAMEASKRMAFDQASQKIFENFGKNWEGYITTIRKKVLKKVPGEEGERIFESLRDSLSTGADFTPEVQKIISQRSWFDFGGPTALEDLTDTVRRIVSDLNDKTKTIKQLFGQQKETPFDPLNASLEELHIHLPKAKQELDELVAKKADGKLIDQQQAYIALIETTVQKRKEELWQIKEIYDEISRINQQIVTLPGGKNDPEYAGLVEERTILEGRLPQTNTPEKGKSALELAQQQIDYVERLRREKEKTVREIEDKNNQIALNEINTTKEGFDKKKALMEKNHEIEMQLLERQKQDSLNRRADMERELFDANPNKTGLFRFDEITLNKEEEQTFDKEEIALKEKYKKEQAAYNAEIEKQLSELTAYKKKELDRQLEDIDKQYKEELKKAQGSQELIDALNEKHEKDRNDAIVKHKMKVNNREQELELAQNESKFQGTGMVELAEREKTRILLEHAEERLKLLKKLEYNEENEHEANVLQKTIDNYKAKQKTQLTPKVALDDKIFKALQKHYLDTGKTAEQAEVKASNFFRGIQNSGEIGVKVVGNLKTAFGGLDKNLDTAMDAAHDVAEGFAKGGLAGGIQSAAGHAINAAKGLLTSKREIDAGLVTYYNNYVQTLSGLIDRNMKLLDKLGGSAFNNTITQTLVDIKKQATAARNLLGEAGRAGSGWNSHSDGYKANKMLKGYSKELKQAGIYTTDWGKMTDEQLMKLAKMPEIYAKLPDGMRKYIDAMVAASDKLDELNQQLKDMLLGFETSDITTAIVDSLTDPSIENAMDNLGSKIDNFIAGIIKNLLVKQVLINGVQKLVDNLVIQLTNRDGDGNIDSFKNVSEIPTSVFTNFKDGVMKIAEGFGQQWKVISDTLKESGIDFTEKAESINSQSASGKGFQSMSQDTGDQLNGRFTALQMSGSNLELAATIRNEHLGIISLNSSEINSRISLLGMSVDEIRDINRQSMNHLYKIEKNTALLNSTNELLTQVVSNTANL